MIDQCYFNRFEVQIIIIIPFVRKKIENTFIRSYLNTLKFLYYLRVETK